jgi:hypothetical protein
VTALTKKVERLPRRPMLFNVLMALRLVISLHPLLFVESAFS